MIHKPKVSIIMNCYNSDTYLKEAIDSIYNQTLPDWEIIFWDNQSTDKSAEIAQSYDDKLKYFRAPEFTNLGKARQLAIQKINGEYLAFLDCDDQWLPEKLQTQVDILDNDLTLAICYSQFFNYFEKNGKKELTSSNCPSGHVFKEFLERYQIGILTAMVRVEVMNRLGIEFDPVILYANDYDFFMRIMFTENVFFIDQPLAVYRYHDNNASMHYKSQFPDDELRALKKLREMDNKGSYKRLIDKKIKAQQVDKACYQLLFKHRYISFAVSLYKDDVLSLKVVLKSLIRYAKNNIKFIINMRYVE